MLNFIHTKMKAKKGIYHVRPSFIIRHDSDMMIRGKSFYACWDEENHIWTTDIFRMFEIMDVETRSFDTSGVDPIVFDLVSDADSAVWRDLNNLIRTLPDDFKTLNSKIFFASDVPKREDYATWKLSYDLDPNFPEAYDRLVSVLYSKEERDKFEWAIGSILAGDSSHIQKFLVFYGDAGTGKSTILDIIYMLFNPYVIQFDAASIGKADARFALEPFASNPLVAIQQDGDLSGIESNARLNSLVAHDTMYMEQKYKPAIDLKSNAMIFIGTNKPVKITDAKSGLRRRLIDVRPTGDRIPFDEYIILKERVKFELGKIANYCLSKYKVMGEAYYNDYIPMEMVEETDYFYNFMADCIDQFQDGVSLKRAYDVYKQYCEDSGYSWKLPKSKFKHELKEYFLDVKHNVSINGDFYRYWYAKPTLKNTMNQGVSVISSADPLPYTKSELDYILMDCPAQLADAEDKPSYKWENVRTTLGQIDTSKTHYVRPPENHIVIDFDLKDETGKKSLERNLKAAGNFPETYMEVSKGGNGLHLHYIYQGDVSELSYIYSEGIEVKTFPGKSSLRRRVSRCNNKPVATISSGLPKKGVKKVVDFDKAMNEQCLRTMILRNVHKEYHPNTTPSVQFIKKLLDDMYERGEQYDVTDMRAGVMTFATRSTNQAAYCVKLVNQMHFASKQEIEDTEFPEEAPMVFFDCEVFPNLFIICWKLAGENNPVVKMINPSPAEVEELIDGRYKLVGFNNRRYDNHILYARYIGESNAALYKRSQGIVGRKDSSCMFGAAYNLSYTDVLDFASAGNKKGLKKWEIELGLKHEECPYPWDEDAPEDVWDSIADYCCNDVVATEAVFNHLQGDWTARLILSELSGLTPNDTTNSQTTKIIFGDEPNPNAHLEYTDLRNDFPGYKFENGKSTYLGVEIGEGGYVYAEPGMYYNVKVFDVVSMHPTSIEQLNLLGKYTKRYSELKQARVAIKHNDKEALSKLLGGSLTRFLENPTYSLKALSNALKTALNSVYGLTSAHFNNPFRDPRNVDNIVAKRGALFMCKLRSEVQKLGYTVVHCKTDSIKVVDPDEFIENYILEFGKKYGYEFEVENVYNRICLVNNAVYIAMHNDKTWDAKGAQFAEPYIFKSLFSKEPLEMSDYWQVKSIKDGAMYLDDVFVGKTGAFLPVTNGADLVKKNNGKTAAVAGTKDWKWREAASVNDISEINMDYYREMADRAVDAISYYGDFERFSDPDCTEDASVPF